MRLSAIITFKLTLDATVVERGIADDIICGTEIINKTQCEWKQLSLFNGNAKQSTDEDKNENEIE